MRVPQQYTAPCLFLCFPHRDLSLSFQISELSTVPCPGRMVDDPHVVNKISGGLWVT